MIRQDRLARHLLQVIGFPATATDRPRRVASRASAATPSHQL